MVPGDCTAGILLGPAWAAPLMPTKHLVRGCLPKTLRIYKSASRMIFVMLLAEFLLYSFIGLHPEKSPYSMP